MANKQTTINGILIGGIAILLVVVVVLSAALHGAIEEVTKYRATYDGIDVYDDGSWDYKAGVEPYFFWNWKGEYEDAWKVYAETGEDITQENGVQVGVAGR